MKVAKERPKMVGLGRLELPTSRLSGVRSNRLSYRPRRRFSESWVESANEIRRPRMFDVPPIWLTPGFTCRILRKEVIQPQVLLQLPCYDFTPIANHTMDSCLPKVSPPASGTTDFRDVTGGVYKARERIHPSMLIRDY